MESLKRMAEVTVSEQALFFIIGDAQCYYFR